MADVKTPVNESEVPFEVWYEGSAREIHGKSLSDIGGGAKIGVGILELPPGSDTRPAHYHTHEEEHLYVLHGKLLLHLGDKAYELSAGSYVHFPAAQEAAHYLSNPGETATKYIMIGERISEDQVIYP